MTALFVMVGGAVGAVTRYWLERWSVHRFRERVPYGTAIANLAGALILGLVVGGASRGAVPHEVLVLVGTGFCGALTTFSGFMGQVENRLRHASTRGIALAYLAITVLGGIALAALGLRVAG